MLSKKGEQKVKNLMQSGENVLDNFREEVYEGAEKESKKRKEENKKKKKIASS